MVRHTGLEFRRKAGLGVTDMAGSILSRPQGKEEVKKLRQDRQFLKWS